MPQLFPTQRLWVRLKGIRSSLGLGLGGRRVSRRMIATNRSARHCGWLVHATRWLASALALVALCLAFNAKADALSAGKRSFERHDYVHAAPLLLVEAERGSALARGRRFLASQHGSAIFTDDRDPALGPHSFRLAQAILCWSHERAIPVG